MSLGALGCSGDIVNLLMAAAVPLQSVTLSKAEMLYFPARRNSYRRGMGNEGKYLGWSFPPDIVRKTQFSWSATSLGI